MTNLKRGKRIYLEIYILQLFAGIHYWVIYGTICGTESCNQPIVRYHIPIKNLASNESFFQINYA